MAKTATAPSPKPKRTLSAAALKKIKASAKRRWALYRAQKAAGQPTAGNPGPKLKHRKRTISKAQVKPFGQGGYGPGYGEPDDPLVILESMDIPATIKGFQQRRDAIKTELNRVERWLTVLGGLEAAGETAAPMKSFSAGG
jgi:hypothetical protein